MRLSHVEGALLAGGASTRMGRDKATTPYEGTPMAERVATALRACLARVRVVVRPGCPPPVDLPVIEDAHELRAPMVGIHAALRACDAAAVLVASCDLPLLRPELLLALLALTPVTGGADIVAPEGPAGPEPLLAVYRPRLLPELERRIRNGELALQDLLRDADTFLIREPELRSLDPELASLTNVNTPALLR